jgi:hypothetical protein
VNKLNTIAIIDTGVNESIFSLPKPEPNLEITHKLKIIKRKQYDSCILSHGSYCAAIIKKFEPNASIASIKIIDDKTGKSNKLQLIRALEWCIENKIKIINLSLGTANYNDFEDVSRIVKKAVEKGIIIVAAYNNFNVYTCPASLPYVIGVKTSEKGKLNNQIVTENKFNNDYVTNSCFILKDCYGNELETQCSNSFAAPFVTAKVYNIVTKEPHITFEQINKRLQNLTIPLSNNNIRNLKPKFKNVIPIICLCNISQNNDNMLRSTLIAHFRDDGYNALIFTDDDSDINQNCSFVPLKYYYDANKNVISERCLAVIERIYEADIFIIDLTKKENITVARDILFDFVVFNIEKPSDINTTDYSAFQSQSVIFTENTQYKNIDNKLKLFNNVDDVYADILSNYKSE